MSDRKFGSWEDAVEWLIAQPDCQDLVRACYFDRPLLAAAQRYQDSDEWQAVRRFLPAAPGRALDVGAGMGIASYALAIDGWQVTALEPDPSHLAGAGAIRRLAGDAGLTIEVLQEWGEQLPLDNASIDVIHARQVLHHACDLAKLCKEMFRVLKPGGRLVATREHVISDESQLLQFQNNHPLHNLYGGECAYRVSHYVSCLKASGFQVCRVLGPWDSVINYAPLTREKMSELFDRRFGGWLGASLISTIVSSSVGFRALCYILARVDRRPGRLYTFIADKLDFA